MVGGNVACEWKNKPPPSAFLPPTCQTSSSLGFLPSFCCLLFSTQIQKWHSNDMCICMLGSNIVYMTQMGIHVILNLSKHGFSELPRGGPTFMGMSITFPNFLNIKHDMCMCMTCMCMTVHFLTAFFRMEDGGLCAMCLWEPSLIILSSHMHKQICWASFSSPSSP